MLLIVVEYIGQDLFPVLQEIFGYLIVIDHLVIYRIDLAVIETEDGRARIRQQYRRMSGDYELRPAFAAQIVQETQECHCRDGDRAASGSSNR